jgi:hypothetical protein
MILFLVRSKFPIFFAGYPSSYIMNTHLVLPPTHGWAATFWILDALDWYRSYGLSSTCRMFGGKQLESKIDRCFLCALCRWLVHVDFKWSIICKLWILNICNKWRLYASLWCRGHGYTPRSKKKCISATILWHCKSATHLNTYIF